MKCRYCGKCVRDMVDHLDDAPHCSFEHREFLASHAHDFLVALDEAQKSKKSKWVCRICGTQFDTKKAHGCLNGTNKKNWIRKIL